MNGSGNCFFGYFSGINTSSGVKNIFIGHASGLANVTGSDNIIIGRNANLSGNNFNNAIAIGTSAVVTANDKMILGNNNVNVGIGLSGAAGGPAKKLEINETGVPTAVAPNPSIPGTFGGSGLRFTKLTSATPVAPSNGKALTVNSNGDVILIPVAGSNLGNNCTTGPSNPLTSNWEIPMNNFNLMFNDNTLGGVSRIGFGFLANTCAPTSNPKFAVENASYNVGGGFNTVFNPVGGGFVVGVAGRAQTNSGVAIGSQGIGRATAGANVAIGVHGSATTTTAPRNIGVHGEASGGVNGNIGVYGQAPINTVITQTPSASPAGINFAGFFNGDVVRIGTDNFTSDATLKTNIDTIQNISGIISALKPRTFNYTNAAHPQMNVPQVKQYGFIAQDVETILPELVMVTTFPAILDSLGNVIYPAFTYKTLNYQALHAFSIKAIQELTKKVNKQDSINNALQSQLTALTSSVSSCCSSTAVRTTNAEELNQLNINLNNNDVIVLNQNVPNPFAEQTTITYNVPEKYGYAQIIFSTIDGRILKTVDITKKGRGQLNVFANDLGNGLYTYSLVVDGKVIDTKKMVKGE